MEKWPTLRGEGQTIGRKSSILFLAKDNDAFILLKSWTILGGMAQLKQQTDACTIDSKSKRQTIAHLVCLFYFIDIMRPYY